MVGSDDPVRLYTIDLDYLSLDYAPDPPKLNAKEKKTKKIQERL